MLIKCENSTSFICCSVVSAYAPTEGIKGEFYGKFANLQKARFSDMIIVTEDSNTHVGRSSEIEKTCEFFSVLGHRTASESSLHLCSADHLFIKAKTFRHLENFCLT